MKRSSIVIKKEGLITTRVARLLLSLLGGVVFLGVFHLVGVETKLQFALHDTAVRFEARRFEKIMHSKSDMPDIRLILVDQYSLQWVQDNLGFSWPWPRELYGLIVDFCSKARVQALDVLFSETSVYGPDDDRRLAQVLEQSGNIVLVATPQSGNLSVIPVEKAKVKFGTASALIDADGMIRRYDARENVADNSFLPALGVAVLKKADLNVTIPAETAFLKYRDASNGFKTYNAAEILSAAIKQFSHDKAVSLDASVVSPEAFQNAIVFIGFSAPGLLDRQAVPVASAMPGVEIHATFVENALTERLAYKLSPFLSWIFIFIFGMIGASLPVVIRKTSLLAIGFFLLAPLVVASNTLLFFMGMVAPGGTALSLTFGSGLTGLLLAYITEGRQRAFLRRSFSFYLAPEVIDQLLRHPDKLKLGGETRIITVLFSDMEGFTGFSEKLAPDVLAGFMNEYMTKVSDIILKYGGTIDKYIGDAVVAFWNAPLGQKDHAERAVLAAAEIIVALEDFCGSVSNLVLPRTRIGIHTGQAVVGNMGSSKRFNYTALGDTMNIASRLEEANKALKTSILISADTARYCLHQEFLAKKKIELKMIGNIKVPGKEQEIEVWEVFPRA
ncbi:MAG: adenylate/guanylate cyclase domain-containing protein [Spirochaetia bacterium]|nr:adenylate/guanylate cyclase domain-containing protein [Spirochaetia bacterium]